VSCPQTPSTGYSNTLTNLDLQQCQSDLKSCSQIKTQVPQCQSLPALVKKTHDPTQSPQGWADDWEKASKGKFFRPGGAAAVFSFIVVKKEKDRYKVLKADAEKTKKLTTLKTPSEDEIISTLDSNIVIDAESGDEKNNCESSLLDIFECFGTDTVLDVSNKTWQLHQFNRSIKTIGILVTAKGREDSQFEKWMRQNLNYDGVVLDIKGQQMLVSLPMIDLPEGTQAITLKDSFTRFEVATRRHASGALMELVSKEGRFAVFKSPVKKANPNDFKPGSKFYIWSASRSLTAAH
jgi:hypothetical protein